MYEDLLRELRCCPDAEYGCSRCKHKDSLHCRETLMRESADAIEELILTAESYKRSMETWADEAANAQPKWENVTEQQPEGGRYVK